MVASRELRYSTSLARAITYAYRVMTTPQGTGAPTNLWPDTLRKVVVGGGGGAKAEEKILSACKGQWSVNVQVIRLLKTLKPQNP